jgi:hypothetical protein
MRRVPDWLSGFGGLWLRRIFTVRCLRGPRRLFLRSRLGSDLVGVTIVSGIFWGGCHPLVVTSQALPFRQTEGGFDSARAFKFNCVCSSEFGDFEKETDTRFSAPGEFGVTESNSSATR